MAASRSNYAGRVFFPSRLKAASLILGASVMMAGAAWMIGEDPSVFVTKRTEVLMVMCVVALVFYGTFMVCWMRELFRARPILEIGPQGVRDRRLGPDTIPWSIVRDIKLIDARRRPVLALSVEVPPGALSRVSGLRRYFSRLSAQTDTHTVQIPLTGLSERPGAVLNTIEDVLTARNQSAALAQAAE